MRNGLLTLIMLSLFSSCEQEAKNDIVKQIEAKASSAENECKRLDILDAEMRGLIEQIEEEYREDQVFRRRLTMSQAYWTQYMDGHARAIFPHDWDRFYRKNYGRDEFNECKCEVINQMILNRITELTFFLDKPQSDCPMIYQIKKP